MYLSLSGDEQVKDLKSIKEFPLQFLVIEGTGVSEQTLREVLPTLPVKLNTLILCSKFLSKLPLKRGRAQG